LLASRAIEFPIYIDQGVAMAKKKNSLVNNINKRKKAGKSRSKKKSTITKKAYNDMQAGWPKKKSAKKKSVKKTAKKKG
jgi:hypothetical protein